MAENKDYSEVVSKTIEILSKNSEWEDIYRHYADEIIKKEKTYDSAGKKFHVRTPLVGYSSMGLVMKSGKVNTFDLRFCGQSVGKVNVDVSSEEPSINLFVSKPDADAAFRSFGYDKSKAGVWDWNSDEATAWRKFYEDLAKKGAISKIAKHREHLIESFLLKEFSKRSSKDKKLCNIQPVVFGGKFFQLKTPLRASKHDEDPKIALTAKKNGVLGGGIDILARVKHSDGQTRLAVIELKDENKPGESQLKTMKQAMTYATFIAKLLRSESGSNWFRIFGFSKPLSRESTINIDVLTLMPEGHSDVGDLTPIHMASDNVVLNPYTLYYSVGKNNLPERFSGTILKDMLSK